MPTGTGIKVKDAMVSKVVTANPSDSAFSAAKIMKEEDVGMLIVLEGKRPAGVVTREDLINKIVVLKKDFEKVKLKEIMNSPIATISPDEDMSDAARIMSQRGLKRLPVISMGKLVGLISYRDVVKVAQAAVEILRERLMREEEPESEAEEQKTEPTAGECELCGNYNETLRNVNDRWVCSECKEEAGEL